MYVSLLTQCPSGPKRMCFLTGCYISGLPPGNIPSKAGYSSGEYYNYTHRVRCICEYSFRFMTDMAVKKSFQRFSYTFFVQHISRYYVRANTVINAISYVLLQTLLTLLKSRPSGNLMNSALECLQLLAEGLVSRLNFYSDPYMCCPRQGKGNRILTLAIPAFM